MDRERLTITLQPNLLHQIDRTVDGARVRNRSHAIELLLGKALSTDVVPVLILAGGKIARNGNNRIPKTLIEVQGEPVLLRTVKRLYQQGYSEVVVSLNEINEKKIQERLSLDAPSGSAIRYTIQLGAANGTATAVRSAYPSLGRTTCIVQYGDVLADIDYNELVHFHRSHRAHATVALTSVEQTNLWGVATMQGARIVDFTEKPKRVQGKRSHLVNAGICVLEPQAIDMISAGSGNLEDVLFPRLAHEGRLYGYPFEGEWQDVGSSG